MVDAEVGERANVLHVGHESDRRAAAVEAARANHANVAHGIALKVSERDKIYMCHLTLTDFCDENTEAIKERLSLCKED